MANLTDHNWQQTSKISVQISPIGTFKIISPLLGNPVDGIYKNFSWRMFLIIPSYRCSFINIYIPFLGTCVHFQLHFFHLFHNILSFSTFNENTSISDLRYSNSYDRLTFFWIYGWDQPSLSLNRWCTVFSW